MRIRRCYRGDQLPILALWVAALACSDEGRRAPDGQIQQARFERLSQDAPTAPSSKEVVTFRTSDSLTIVGELHLPGSASASSSPEERRSEPDRSEADRPRKPAPLILLGHQLGKDRHSWDPLVPRLVAAGYAVLAVDHRAFGESVREVPSPSKLNGFQRNALHLDLLEAIPAVGKNARVDTSRVAIVASGLSVTPAVRCAIQNRAVSALAFLPGNFEIDAEEFLMANPRLPTLLVASGGDSQGSYLMRSYGSRLTGENQRYFELGLRDAEAARWKGTDGLTEETGLIDLIVWFLEQNFPADTNVSADP